MNHMSAASHLRFTDEWSHEGGMKQSKVLEKFLPTHAALHKICSLHTDLQGT